MGRAILLIIINNPIGRLRREGRDENLSGIFETFDIQGISREGGWFPLFRILSQCFRVGRPTRRDDLSIPADAFSPLSGNGFPGWAILSVTAAGKSAD